MYIQSYMMILTTFATESVYTLETLTHPLSWYPEAEYLQASMSTGDGIVVPFLLLTLLYPPFILMLSDVHCIPYLCYRVGVYSRDSDTSIELVSRG